MYYDERVKIRWDPTITAQERIDVIIKYGRRFSSIRTFVETGTANGDTCYALQEYFTRLYTIELVPSSYESSRTRLQEFEQIKCLFGDSAQVLPQLLAEINEPCLFWLDGHWSGSLEARGAVDTPVASELATIFATGLPHVILIDDARLFGRDPAYPTLEWVRDLATSQHIGFDFSYSDDIMRVVPARSTS